MQMILKIVPLIFVSATSLFLIANQLAQEFTMRRFENNKTFNGTVDLVSYAGKWYQIIDTKAETPFLTQIFFSFLQNVDEPCYNTTVNYSLREDGIFLKNECFVGGERRRRIEITGFATPINKENTKFKVRFSPWYMRVFSFDYWIVDVDPTYTLAVLSSPSSKGITIISRTASPDMKLLNRALSIAESLGYDLSKSVKSPQLQ